MSIKRKLLSQYLFAFVYDCTPIARARVSRAKTNIINLESLKMNLWPRVELDGRARRAGGEQEAETSKIKNRQSVSRSLTFRTGEIALHIH